MELVYSKGYSVLNHNRLWEGTLHSMCLMVHDIPQTFASTLFLVVLLMTFIKKIVYYMYLLQAQHEKLTTNANRSWNVVRIYFVPFKS